jgi:hypothetical protein
MELKGFDVSSAGCIIFILFYERNKNIPMNIPQRFKLPPQDKQPITLIKWMQRKLSLHKRVPLSLQAEQN